MIGKIKRGGEFAGCLRYILDHDKAEILGVAALNVTPSDSLEISELSHSSSRNQLKVAATALANRISMTFNFQASLRPEVNRPVCHISLNFAQEDKPRLTNGFLLKIAEEYLGEMGFRKDGQPVTQYLIAKHTKSDGGVHLHLCVNMVAFDGSAFSTSFDFENNREICRSLTERHNLALAEGKGRTNRESLRGRERARYIMFDLVKAAAVKACSYTELEALLKRDGVEMRVSSDGISFSRVFNGREQPFAGSEIDKSLSKSSLDKLLLANRRKAEALKLTHEVGNITKVTIEQKIRR